VGSVHGTAPRRGVGSYLKVQRQVDAEEADSYRDIFIFVNGMIFVIVVIWAPAECATIMIE
jgi:hypothetical protein